MLIWFVFKKYIMAESDPLSQYNKKLSFFENPKLHPNNHYNSRFHNTFHYNRFIYSDYLLYSHSDC